jgi:hypothetical protein
VLDQILILFSTANAFHLLEEEGVLEVIKEASSEHNVKIRILVDVRQEGEAKEIKEKVKLGRAWSTYKFSTHLKAIISNSKYNTYIRLNIFLDG